MDLKLGMSSILGLKSVFYLVSVSKLRTGDLTLTELLLIKVRRLFDPEP